MMMIIRRRSEDGGDGEVSVVGDGDEEMEMRVIEEKESWFLRGVRGAGEEGEVFPSGFEGGIEGLIGGLFSGPTVR